MAKLSARQRDQLPDSAFAYIDSEGNRRLPINDEGHVRSALSRFNQVKFESTEARERAFRKVLTTAIGYGIAPVGFVAAQMRRAREGEVAELPDGPVTFLISDMEGSTGLIDRLGDEYPLLLDRVRSLIGSAVEDHHGYEVDARADEFFAVFAAPFDAVETAVAVQRQIAASERPEPVRVRIGLHSGTPARTETGYVGLAVNTVSRICDAGHGGQILASALLRDQLVDDLADGWAFHHLGAYRLRGLPDDVDLFQMGAPGLSEEFPPLRFTTSDQP